MLRETGLSNQVKLSNHKTHVPMNKNISTVRRSILSLCDRQKALGMIDKKTNACEYVKQ